MNPPNIQDNRSRLQSLARQAMLQHGLLPDFTAEAISQANALQVGTANAVEVRDLRDRLWVSIDNDDSRDLDQLSVAQPVNTQSTQILVAIADVDSAVQRDSPIDVHAAHNTTSVYTVAKIFPMLPERLSTDLTSLGEAQERLAIIIDLTVAADGVVAETAVYSARVINKAKLAYDAVAAWLDGKAQPPPPLNTAALQEQIRIQDRVAQALGKVRHERGALSFETTETRAVFDGASLRELLPQRQNRAQDLIENLMIAANEGVARWLASKSFPSIRRVLRTPQKWSRIVQLASEAGEHLPESPDPVALSAFLAKRRVADPIGFPDLSLAVIKLLGRGEYAVAQPGQQIAGHFGLAVSDYLHATAPNRRFPDLLTQRLLKAALAKKSAPYSNQEMTSWAANCTQQEDNAAKVERQVRKSAAALLLQTRIGQVFDAIVTGAADKGTWARITAPPVEGRIVEGFNGLEVGQRVRVRLLATDVSRGFIDFARVEDSP